MKQYIFIFIGLLTIVLSGCIFQKENDEATLITPEIEIPVNETIPKQAISQIATTEKKMALTFNGLPDEETILRLLDELDRFKIKATFFLPGMRVAEDPELASEILKRG